MSEFERTPESIREELSELSKERESIDKQIILLMAAQEQEQVTETEFDKQETILGSRGDKVNRQTYELLIALQDYGSIKARLTEYAEAVIEEMGDDMPISASEMMMSTFGIYDMSEISPNIENIVDDLTSRYLILQDEDASENEQIKAEPDWEPTE